MGLSTLAAMVLLSAMVVAATSVGTTVGSGGGAGSGGRVGVRALLEEAPTRLRLAAAVIVSAVRELSAHGGDRSRGGAGSAVACVPTSLYAMLTHHDGGVTGSVPSDADLWRAAATPLRESLLAIPPPSV